jgi:hypothetical protein
LVFNAALVVSSERAVRIRIVVRRRQRHTGVPSAPLAATISREQSRPADSRELHGFGAQSSENLTPTSHRCRQFDRASPPTPDSLLSKTTPCRTSTVNPVRRFLIRLDRHPGHRRESVLQAPAARSVQETAGSRSPMSAEARAAGATTHRRGYVHPRWNCLRRCSGPPTSAWRDGSASWWHCPLAPSGSTGAPAGADPLDPPPPARCHPQSRDGRAIGRPLS